MKKQERNRRTITKRKKRFLREKETKSDNQNEDSWRREQELAAGTYKRKKIQELRQNLLSECMTPRKKKPGKDRRVASNLT
jgi:hypothetical protein